MVRPANGVAARSPARSGRPAREAVVRDLGRTRYPDLFEAMRAYTNVRDDRSADEIWLTEHEPVFTQGQAGRPEHVLAPGDIPVIRTDRGGQVTYHGPGQIVAYLMFDIRRLGLSVRDLVSGIEQAMISVLRGFGVEGEVRAGAPGVYVRGMKIGALGLRVRRGCSYHGLSLNVDVDLEPFARINPCGFAGLPVIRLADLVAADIDDVRRELLGELGRAYRLTLRTPDSSAASAV